jgi:hypothetical protein
VRPTDAYILKLDEPYKSIVCHLIAVIEHLVPTATLEYKWTVPYFYYQNKPLCYLHVSPKNKYVDLGFAKGFQLKHNLDCLIADKGRNTVKSLRYYSLESIDNTLIQSVVKEAITI